MFKKTLSLCGLLFILGSSSAWGVDNLGEDKNKMDKGSELVIDDRLLQVRFDLVKRLLKGHKYREALNELEMMKKEVSKNNSYYLNFWIGNTYHFIGGAMKAGVMVEDEQGNLLYLREAELIRLNKSTQEDLKEELHEKKNYFTTEELAVLKRTNTLLTTDKSVFYDQRSVGINMIALSKSTKNYFEKSIQHFNHVIESQDNSLKAQAILNKARTFLEMGEDELALEEYRFFVQTHPKHVKNIDARVSLGNLLFKMEKYEDALIVFKSSLEKFGSHPEAGYIRLKIDYINLFIHEKSIVEEPKKDLSKIKERLKLLAGFEKEILDKEERLKQLETDLKPVESNE